MKEIASSSGGWRLEKNEGNHVRSDEQFTVGAATSDDTRRIMPRIGEAAGKEE